MEALRETEGRQIALDKAILNIEKTYGKGAVMRLSGDDLGLDADAIPTGSVGLDMALGVGGYPRGRIVEVYGPESSGKTTLALHAIASVQAQGGTAAFIDAEHAMDGHYAQKLGVDLEHLLVAQPDCGEQALEIVERLVTSGAVDNTRNGFGGGESNLGTRISKGDCKNGQGLVISNFSQSFNYR